RLTSLMLAAALPVSAQELPSAGTVQPDVVVTATRIPTPVADIPAGVTVITRRQIEDHAYDTLAQALEDVPGVRVAQSGGPGGNASIFIRGTNSNQTLVLRDGFPINDASDPGGAFNFSVDTLADVERIEVIRGPMASLYGSGAIGGVINLITRRGTQAGPHVTADVASGYPAQVRDSEVLSGVSGKFDYAAIVQVEKLRGFDTTPQRESIFTGVPDGFADQVGTVNLGYTPLPGTRFSLLLRARRAVFGFNAFGFPTFDNANSMGHDASLLGRAGVHSLLAGGVVETDLYLGRLQDDRRFSEALNTADPNRATNDSRFHSYRTDLQWNNTAHLGDLLAAKALSALDLTFGFERTADTAKTRINSSSGGFAFAQSTAGAQTDEAVHVGVQANLLSRLTLTGQARQDWVLNNHPATWRLGAVFDAPELRTRFKASYGTAFLAPSLFDRFGVDSTGFVGNPNLRAETAQGWEAGFTTSLSAFGRDDAISFGATYFNEQITDLIVEVFSPITTSVNIGSAHIQGAESTLSLRPARWLVVDATYTYVYPENADTGARLLRRPQSTASLDARITPLPRLTIVPELVFTGAFRDFLTDNGGFATAIGTSRQGLIANLTASYQLTPKIRLYANGTNIFASRFEPVNGFQTPGPSVIVGLRLTL
ncbi:MAG: TonB-dependent receptor, partial [Acetobacteraceae bacterium]